MLADSSWLASALLLWDPWLLIVALGSLGLFALVLFVRRALRKHGDRVAGRFLLAAVVSGVLAFFDLVVFLCLLDRSDLTPPSAWLGVTAALLIVFLLGLLGCGGYTVWRLIEAPASTPAAQQRQA